VNTVSEIQSGYVNNRILKLQVGFLLSEAPGQSRDIEFEVPTLKVSDDLTVDFLLGKLHLSRTSRGILVQGTLETSIGAQCVRCLEDVPVVIGVPINELFVHPPEPGEVSNLDDSGVLDLTPLLREEIILNTPSNILCRANCAGLCLTCGKNLNEGQCECHEDNIDPRFAKLKELRDSLDKRPQPENKDTRRNKH
jgi:uncharacterized protein